MSKRPEGEFHSPIDPLLEGFPLQPPPADLEQRCVNALHEAASERPLNRRFHLRPVAVAAALLMLVLGVATFPRVVPKVTGDDRQGAAEDARVLVGPPVAPPASPVDSVTALPERPYYKSPLPRTGEPPAGDSVVVERTGGAVWRGPAQPPSPYVFGTQSGYTVTQIPGSAEPKVDTAAGQGAPSAPAAPWEDTGGERQKEVYKRLEMEVDDVELAHKEAVRIIDGAGGYVAQEDLTTTADSGSEAHLSARIPVDRLEDAVARLRDLGRVVGLHGTSEDRTAEYYGRGKQVRESSAEEARIVAQYEKEKDRAKKQALYARLTQVRSKLKSQKDTLQELGARTHYATVEVLLTQRQGAGEFVAQVGGRAVLALVWFLATALIWGPLLLLILTLRWRRPRADRPSEAPQE